MLRALVVLCLVWAGVHAALTQVTALARHEPELTRRSACCVLQGASAPRVRLLESREPQPAPFADGPPFWSSTRTFHAHAPLRLAGAVARGAVDTALSSPSLGDPRTSRGPPRQPA
jgi:hypothetical protein